LQARHAGFAGKRPATGVSSLPLETWQGSGVFGLSPGMWRVARDSPGCRGLRAVRDESEKSGKNQKKPVPYVQVGTDHAIRARPRVSFYPSFFQL